MIFIHNIPTFSFTEYSLKVEGAIKFRDGFVNKIASAHLDDRKFSHGVGERESRISMTLMFDFVQVVYDVDYDLKDFKQTGSIIIEFGDVNFIIEIGRNHETKLIEPKISLVFTNTGGQYRTDIEVFPSNGYTQLISREVNKLFTNFLLFSYFNVSHSLSQLKRKKQFRRELEESFEDWKAPIINALKEAIGEIPFPEIIYYSPEKE